jgi:hypothetical protein
MHPRERPTTTRQFLIRAGVAEETLSGADALLSVGGRWQRSAWTKAEVRVGMPQSQPGGEG